MTINNKSLEDSIFIKRFLAFFIDIIICFPILTIFALLINLVIGNPFSNFDIYIRIVISFSIPIWIYFIFSDFSKNGQTLGKKITKLNVKTAENKELTFSKALIRTAIKLIPWELIHISFFALATNEGFSVFQISFVALDYILMFIYVIFLFKTKGKVAIHDYLAKTVVQSSIAN